MLPKILAMFAISSEVMDTETEVLVVDENFWTKGRLLRLKFGLASALIFKSNS